MVRVKIELIFFAVMTLNSTGILIGNATGGISLAWWKRSHNVHHVVCNSIENDPDIQHLPVSPHSKLLQFPINTYSTLHPPF